MDSRSVSGQTTDPPQELSLTYFESHPRTYSSQVLHNLESNQFFRFLFEDRSKEPTPRDMLLVSSVLVSAMDHEIATLKAEKAQLQKEASTVRAILGRPLFVARELPPAADQPTDRGDAPPAADPSEAAKKAEREWISRYMTLGNVLGAIVIILGMLGGVLTYFTTNYKDRAERAEGSATFWEKQADGFKKAAETAQNAQTNAEQGARTQRDNDAKTISDLNNRLSQSQALSNKLTDQLTDTAKKYDDLQKTCTPPPK